MKQEECKHEWQEDENFSNGAVIMITGTVGDMKREIRMVCKKCGEIDYVTKEEQE